MQTSLHRLNGLLSELKIERDFTQAFIFAPKPPNEIFGRVSKEQSTFEKETLVHFVLAPSKET